VKIATVVAAAMLTACSAQPRGTIPQIDGFGQSGSAARFDGARLVLRVFDAHGRRIPWRKFRAREEDGQGANGIDDALLDPPTLSATRTGPLYSSDGSGSGDPALNLPAGGPKALSLAWPTSDGYSNLILDLPNRGGTYDFDDVAARRVLADIRTSLDSRPWYHPGSEVRSLRAIARANFEQARHTPNGAEREALFARSLDFGVRTEMRLLEQAGVAYAAAHPNADEWGVTFDTIAGGISDLRNVKDLYPRGGWLRICFDPGERPRYYASEVKLAHSLGVRVIGQILDSSEMRRMSLAAFERRTRAYVDALPEVDEWEAGNEVNGNWLGSTASVVAKTRYASRYVKTHTHARVLVTLYWELGEGRVANSMFTWAHANLQPIVADVDDIGISLYPRQSPMGEPFDRVVTALHDAFPRQRIMVTELDYDRGPGWGWTSRDAVATTYQSAILGYPYSGGGTFWWYFVEEASHGNSLYEALRSVYRSAHPTS
jgi:hypothetical protein